MVWFELVQFDLACSECKGGRSAVCDVNAMRTAGFSSKTAESERKGYSNPIETAVLFWGQTINCQISSSVSPKRDCVAKVGGCFGWSGLFGW